MARNNEYWKKRQEKLQESLIEPADKYCKELEKAYKNTIKDIEKDIAVWYQRFADNNGIVDKVEAKRILKNKELKELKWDVNQYIKAGEQNGITKNWAKELENASARYHISRLEALKIQMQQKIEELYGGREDKVKSLLGDIYTEGNYKNAYEIAQKTGAHFSFAKIDNNKLNKVLSKPWTTDDNTFSEKIWQNRKTLVNTVHQELIKGISRGTAPIAVANVIAKKMNTDLWKAQRLVITESAFFASEAQRDCYNNLDVEKYQVLCTLDHSTCSECGGMDGQVFDVKDMVEGVNAPPFHPYCRCTTVPYFNDEFTEDEMRAARDEDSKTVYVKDMTYNEWKEKYIVNNVEKSAESGIIKKNNVESGAFKVHTVGKIDKNIYSCITDDIITDDVIITDERIQHIKEHHPNDYERFSKYFKDIVQSPDYIVSANRPKTALILKEINENGEKFKTALRLITSIDNKDFKNSIITFMKIDDKEWNRLLKNKKILYKKE